MDYKTALTGYRLTHDDVVNMRIAGHIRDETGMTMCDHCYTGIKNIVLVSGGGKSGQIGSTCAEILGFDKYQLRKKLTHDEMEKRKKATEDYRKKAKAEFDREQSLIDAQLERRMESPVGDIVRRLESITVNSDAYREARDKEMFLENDFMYSLAIQLRRRPLSNKQAEWVSKFVAGGQTQRRNKGNAEEYDRIWDVCISDEFFGISYSFLNSIKSK